MAVGQTVKAPISAFDAGAASARAGVSASDSPYSQYSQKGKDWHKGWRSILLQGPRRPKGYHPRIREERQCLYCGKKLFVIKSRTSGPQEKKFCSKSCSSMYHFGWLARKR